MFKNAYIRTLLVGLRQFYISNVVVRVQFQIKKRTIMVIRKYIIKYVLLAIVITRVNVAFFFFSE